MLPLLLSCHTPAGPPSFLIIDIDSFPASRMLAERDGQPVAPTMARLARQGWHFTEAFSQSAWTLPAVYSLLTGQHPVLMEEQDNTLPAWEDSTRTLPQILSYYGYRSAAWWGHTIVSGSPQYSQGFAAPAQHADQYDLPLADWIGQSSDPFLIFVHNIDLHLPAPRIPEAALHRYVAPIAGCPGQSPPADFTALRYRVGDAAARTHILGHYDGQIRYYDDALADMLGELERAGVAEQTVVIVTSDHGEELFERGEVRHGVHYDTVLRIPLIIYDPGQGSGEISTIVQTVDLAATVLDRAGVAADATMDGASLLPLMGRAGTYTAREVFSISNRHNASLRSATHKALLRSVYIAHDIPGTAQAQESGEERALYDLRADPDERINLLLADHPPRSALLDRLLVLQAERMAATGDIPRTPLEDAQKKRLQDQGYWELVHPSPDTPPAQPAP